MADHPLDRPAWAALTSRQAHWAEGGPDALRFPSDVSPFAASRDDSPENLAKLAALTPEGGGILLARRGGGPIPPGLVIEVEAEIVQMHAVELVAPDPSHEVIPLGDADAPEMLELATMTRPGPFLLNTHRLGRFIGIRREGRLAAMAGERLHADGYREVSAVCTHPDFRGRGLAGLLSRIVADRIVRDGETPFLHAYTTNAAAIRLYEQLGFRYQRTITVQWLKRA
ncbi:GNAT family N-acetyltransferase [Oricola nitratireducens]|uniref:GNAT family N-acetyltransferase n=1 Tax=Oricola nitratireducens TaxID=2775868 RepID=UPI0018673CDD|nr:GNAT family N-acetyltransferase [Oricola nitratireducens]